MTTPIRQRVTEENPPASFTDHTVHAMVCALRCVGFTDGNAIGREADVSDRPVEGLIYLKREHCGQHQYVSIMTFEGRFLEAVVQVYAQTFNMRKRQLPLYSMIHRDLPTALAALDCTYSPPPPPPPKRDQIPAPSAPAVLARPSTP